MLRFLRKYHKWFSLVATIFILFFAASGIILNHREMLSGIDVNRKLLPPGYRYNSWNLAAVKGAVVAGNDSVLIYGNIGVWLTDSTFSSFRDFNADFPRGIDNRKINTMSWSAESGLYAGTLFGLYRFDGASWVKVQLPVGGVRIVKVLHHGDSLLVMTRSNLFVSSSASGYQRFREIHVSRGEDDDGEVGLFKTIWVIHSGEIYGLAGKLIVDGVGIIFIILCITGLIYFFVPYRLKSLKDEIRRSKLKQFNKTSLKWHNVVGSWAILILLLNTATGIFLRPPLLIPIAGVRVEKLKYTELDDPNPWFDRFRDLIYDSESGRYLVATSEGIYYSDDRFGSELKKFDIQPPVSVMGINVFEILEPGRYLVGSFSGIFEWSPSTSRIIDFFTGLEFVDTGQRGAPFGNLTVAGYLKMANGSEYIFDYAAGAIGLKSAPPFVQMDDPVIKSASISLWNVMLEVHTGRIFEPILGQLYILVVPIIGIFTLFILVTGFFAWWLAKRKKDMARLK